MYTQKSKLTPILVMYQLQLNLLNQYGCVNKL